MAEKKKKTPKFQPGDKVRCAKYGNGFCHQVNPEDKEFMYDFHFEDGTLIWMGQKYAEKNVELTHRSKVAATA